ncbi:sulfite exporter TauE/SafE family protein [Leifsonella bigeumensis]|uniref:sulfite exporter TauE/SafE family protein n=1 Tax=Leifsonella bigeumensis TaxID=433643 RepID=UPI0031D582F8
MLATIICVGAGVITGATGFGFGLVAVPLLGVVIDPRAAVVISLVAGLPGAAWVMLRSKAPIAGRQSLVMVITAAVGMPAGLWAAWQLSTDALSVTIGILVIVSTIAVAMGLRFAARDRSYVTAGLLSGFLAPGTGMGGPPIVIAIQGSGFGAASARRTSAAVLSIQSVLAFAVIAVAGGVNLPDLLFASGALPATLVGTLIGSLVFAKMSEARARAVVLVVLLASGLGAIAHGFGLYG